MGSCKSFDRENHIRRAESRYGGFTHAEPEIFDYLPGCDNRHRLSIADVEKKLGICLGAQLLAAALVAKVHPGDQGSEIGWGAVTPSSDLHRYASLVTLINGTERFLHWHGDTFELPLGATRLAQTDKYLNQAFALEDFALGLQFHAEVTAETLE